MTRHRRLHTYVLRFISRLRDGIRSMAHVLWRACEVAIGDDAHWKVIRRLLAVIGAIALVIAARYGWLTNEKLDWLVKLFSPLFNAELPRGVTP